MRTFILAMLAVCVVGGAQAQEAEGEFVPPEWVERPHERDFRQHYPRAAREAGQPGRVILDCLINLDSTLECNVAGENPSDQGFGDAAVAMSHSWRVRPATRGGIPVESVRLSVPVAFNVR